MEFEGKFFQRRRDDAPKPPIFMFNVTPFNPSECKVMDQGIEGQKIHKSRSRVQTSQATS